MKHFLQRFLKDQSGTSSIEIVLVFPVFFGFFLMTYEAGILSSRQVMLERGLDITVRKVRVGAIDKADQDELRTELRKSICDNAGILPDCETQLEVEMIQRDPRAVWNPISTDIQCVDRGDINAPSTSSLANTANNELLFLRACIRIDPFLASSTLGKTLVAGNDTAAGDSYALIATAAFVVEPFRADP
ncbi:TadE/TadG family type IV pilus assembly protein [Roseobacter sp. CCS2]|uniref:TadE/TadG family type IV pilus assembly protein n=1 Tax=Roseobacter sp. CCS2 TaxID=391593 RepID=UPI0000F40487|nr:hypothetical protein [Roseobacter sp. CCS2]EBA12940.1 hypothetical protein RCCS2_03624 [Roseobacter sp. CCS2]